jgi:hypothetical protein
MARTNTLVVDTHRTACGLLLTVSAILHSRLEHYETKLKCLFLEMFPLNQFELSKLGNIQNFSLSLDAQ